MEIKFHRVGYMTVEECDNIAYFNAGVVFSFSGSADCPEGGKINEEYSSFVTKTLGLGNEGFIVLRGLNPRTKELIRRGKIRRLISFGVRKKVSEIAVSCKHGNEENVAVLADMLLELCKKFQFSGESFKDFYKFAPFSQEFVKENKMSFPRILSAIAIAEKVNGK